LSNLSGEPANIRAADRSAAGLLAGRSRSAVGLLRNPTSQDIVCRWDIKQRGTSRRAGVARWEASDGHWRRGGGKTWNIETAGARSAPATIAGEVVARIAELV